MKTKLPLLAAAVLTALPLLALENEAARREQLQRLRGAISAYGILHAGKAPARLSDLVNENLLDGPASVMRPGTTTVPPQAELDAHADYTLETLDGAKDLVVRERAPLAGEGEVLAAFKDGSIKPLPAKAAAPAVAAPTVAPPRVSPPVAERTAPPAISTAGTSTASATATNAASAATPAANSTAPTRELPPGLPTRPAFPFPPATTSTMPAATTSPATLPTETQGDAITLNFPPDNSPVIAIPPAKMPARKTPPAPVLGVKAATLDTAQEAFDAGRINDARTAFAALAQREPDSAQAQLGLGRSASLAGDLGAATSALLNVARLEPETPGLRVWIAEAFLARGNARSAQQWLDTEVRSNPTSALGWSWLGTLQLESGKKTEAAASMARAAQLDPNVAAVRAQHGAWLLAHNQAKRALLEFTAVQLMNPRDPGAIFQMAECHLKLGQREQAAENFKRYLAAAPTGEHATVARARLQKL